MDFSGCYLYEQHAYPGSRVMVLGCFWTQHFCFNIVNRCKVLSTNRNSELLSTNRNSELFVNNSSLIPALLIEIDRFSSSTL